MRTPLAWSCSDRLRVLRLGVERPPDNGDPKLLETLDRFYERIGQCRQLEELAIGYSDPILQRFWDLTIRSSAPNLTASTSSTMPKWEPSILSQSSTPSKPRFFISVTRAKSGSDRESGCLHRLAGLSKLRIFSLTRGDLWSRMGQPEVEFMAEHWPVLQTIEIAGNLSSTLNRRHWQWLLQRRLGLSLTVTQVGVHGDEAMSFGPL